VKVVRAIIRLVGIRRRRQGRARYLQSLAHEIRERCFDVPWRGLQERVPEADSPKQPAPEHKSRDRMSVEARSWGLRQRARHVKVSRRRLMDRQRGRLSLSCYLG